MFLYILYILYNLYILLGTYRYFILFRKIQFNSMIQFNLMIPLNPTIQMNGTRPHASLRCSRVPRRGDLVHWIERSVELDGIVKLNWIVLWNWIVEFTYLWKFIYVFDSQDIQSINNAIKIRIKRWTFWTYFLKIWIFDIFEKIDCWKCMFVLMVCFVLEIIIFNAFIGFCVIFCI